jgi:hypothetical protein
LSKTVPDKTRKERRRRKWGNAFKVTAVIAGAALLAIPEAGAEALEQI